jgi:hypothetical protein
VPGRYAHPLWKNGCREESPEERRREKTGALPITELKLEWNCLIVIDSSSDEAKLPLALI